MKTSEIVELLWQATKQTLTMVSISISLAVLLGILLGLVLYITATPLLYQNKWINGLAGFIINVIRSIPFIILLVLLMPVTSAIVGTVIGPKAVTVPLTVAATTFLARLVEGALSEVDKGIIEASLAMGANFKQIIWEVLLVEALPGIIRAITVTLISIIGFSAMAGTVGGGGIGDLAIRYGYQRYQTDILFVTVVFLVIVVQMIQVIGEKIAVYLTKK
ncbi:methionine ABC transporter permease [Sporanaerobium hydrogeniformans]|uniref:Methionine ABC transporter permease n=1 Tax=Sporanaerobium hydrogeniformans TaxID=3072179 RepID=A0AC61D6G7_9FIRM|nr:methionine ABC transporter permease [Sporanaerobium hydrogeniformans]PHV69334.1 methionine ABC transporter permease [Sporanaerobium hydrogeniformans]